MFFIFNGCPPDAPSLPAADSADACYQRCAGFEGQERYRCMQTCANVSRKNRKKDAPSTREKLRRCEEFCSGYRGVDQVKCLRICMDRFDEFQKAGGEKPEEKKDEPAPEDNPCAERCRTLSEPYRSQCMQRCRKAGKGQQRKEPGVW